jgi:hypothetical protein
MIVALVKRLDPEEPGGGTRCGCGAFALPPYLEHIFGGVVDGGFPNIHGLGQPTYCAG